MRVVCTDVKTISTLTEGKSYEVISESQRYYRLLADDGVKRKFFKKYFEKPAPLAPGVTMVGLIPVELG